MKPIIERPFEEVFAMFYNPNGRFINQESTCSCDM